MDYSSFRTSELKGWSARAAHYDDATARATTQTIPTLLACVRVGHGMRLLDLGCGPGYATGAAAALGVHAEGIDFSPQMVASAKKRFPEGSFDVGDVEALDFLDGRFDAVVGNLVLFHVTDPARAMAEACRVLVPGGRFAFSQWAGPSESPLYGAMMPILYEHMDGSAADPAPDAFALSDREATCGLLRDAGFDDVAVVNVPNVLVAPGPSFFDFFMRFGVRVPLLVEGQKDDVRARIRKAVDTEFERFRRGGAYVVPIPSLVYAGRRPPDGSSVHQ